MGSRTRIPDVSDKSTPYLGTDAVEEDEFALLKHETSYTYLLHRIITSFIAYFFPAFIALFINQDTTFAASDALLVNAAKGYVIGYALYQLAPHVGFSEVRSETEVFCRFIWCVTIAWKKYGYFKHQFYHYLWYAGWQMIADLFSLGFTWFTAAGIMVYVTNTRYSVGAMDLYTTGNYSQVILGLAINRVYDL